MWIISNVITTAANELSHLTPKIKVIKIIYSIIMLVLTCEKCLSFWLTLALTQNFFTAASVSLLIMITTKIERSKTKL